MFAQQQQLRSQHSVEDGRPLSLRVRQVRAVHRRLGRERARKVKPATQQLWVSEISNENSGQEATRGAQVAATVPAAMPAPTTDTINWRCQAVRTRTEQGNVANPSTSPAAWSSLPPTECGARCSVLAEAATIALNSSSLLCTVTPASAATRMN